MLTPKILKPTVVVVDDSIEVGTVLADLLEIRGGFEVLAVVASAAQGVETIERLHPDVALIDYMLGDGLGSDVVERLRTLGVGSVLVVTSGLGVEVIESTVLAAGADACIPKAAASRIPDQIRELLAGVKSAH